VPIRLPALGLSVLQLQLGLDGHHTLPSSVRVYLHGLKLSVSRHEAFPLRIIDSSSSDFAISNRYVQAWFSGLTGQLRVKDQGWWGRARAQRRACAWVGLSSAVSCHLVDSDLGVVHLGSKPTAWGGWAW
jgi:alpha-mannosidase II